MTANDLKDLALALMFFALGILGLENWALNQVVQDTYSRYLPFMAKPFRGRPLYEEIKEGTLGVFATKGRTIVCAEMTGTISRQP